MICWAYFSKINFIYFLFLNQPIMHSKSPKKADLTNQSYKNQMQKKSLQSKIKKLNTAIQKIKKMQSELQVQELGKLNKTMYLPVKIKHTSQFTVHLGVDYYAQVKGKTAVQILQRKKQRFSKTNRELQIQKVQNNKNTQGTKEKPKQVKIGNGVLQVIGEQNGQQIINIVEINDQKGDANGKQQSQDPKQNQEGIQKNEDDLKQKQLDILQVHENQKQEKLHKKMKQQNIQKAKAEQQANSNLPQKKMSKFKAQRMKQRQN